MEPLTIALAIFLSFLSSVGFIGDRIAEQQLRKQFKQVEQLEVRLEAVPTYQIAQGRLDRVLIAGRGLYPIESLRIDTLEVETDPITLKGLRPKLAKPLQAGVRLIITEQDLNQALRSPTVTNRLKNLGIRFLQADEAAQISRYDFVNPQIDFQPNGKVKLQVELLEQGYPDKLAIVAEAKLKLVSGQTLQLENPSLLVNGQPAPPFLVDAIAQAVSQRLNLQQLEKSRTTARILTLTTEADRLEMSLFIQTRP
jgi:LmeA-like phospholipid-binding